MGRTFLSYQTPSRQTSQSYAKQQKSAEPKITHFFQGCVWLPVMFAYSINTMTEIKYPIVSCRDNPIQLFEAIQKVHPETYF